MHIEGMKVAAGSHPAFFGEMAFRFDKTVNVFVGPNASGKTSLLRLLASANNADEFTKYSMDPPELQLSDDWVTRFENPPLDSPMYCRVQDIIQSVDPSLGIAPPWLWAVPITFIPATRVMLAGEFDWEDQTLSLDEVQKFAEGIDWKDNAHVFDGRWIAKVYKFLYDNYKQRDLPRLRELVAAARLAHRCGASIANEVLTGHGRNYVSYRDRVLSHDFAHDLDDFDPLMVEPYVHPGMAAQTKRNLYGRYEEQYVGDLSSGTQSALLWVIFLGLRMIAHYENWLPKDWEYAFGGYGSRWHRRPAILLIDEIENHLHPTWQRRVIPALLEHFPGVQIFATTHSPFVVAGLKSGQVHLLNRDADGTVTASTNTEDIVGWTTDEILRTFMGVDDPTDEVTARAASELRQLRDEGPRDTGDAEAARQARMHELRRLVDRDLLAGGPAAAQQELFEQQFAEALEKYQRSRDLGQDNG